MNKQEFMKELQSNTLTAGTVMDFFAQDAVMVAETLRDLTQRGSGDEGDWHGFRPAFAEVIQHVLKSPEAMSKYIKYFIVECWKNSRLKPILPTEQLRWMVGEVEFKQASDAIWEYLSWVTIPVDQQEIIMFSPSSSFWNKLCEHQEITPELQSKLLYNAERAFGNDVAEWETKFGMYIRHRKFDFYTEYEFLASSIRRISHFKLQYVKNHGLSERMRDIMLTDLWLNK